MIMKKKMMIIFIVSFLICIMPSVPSIAFNKLGETQVSLNNNCDFNLVFQQFNQLGFLDEKYPVMTELPNVDPSEYSKKPSPINILDSFSWKDYDGFDWTTPAKHQGQCGSCWAFAALGVYESMIKIREGNAFFNPDLSEQYLLSCIDGAGSCHGGNAFRVFQLLNDTSASGNYHDGIIPESCFLYQADDSIPCDEKCSDWDKKLIPIYDFGTWKINSNDQEIIDKSRMFI